MDEIDGVANDVPACCDVPPVEATNQFIVPALLVALSVTEPVPHREPGVDVKIVGVAVIVANTDVRDAVVQPLLTAST